MVKNKRVVEKNNNQLPQWKKKQIIKKERSFVSAVKLVLLVLLLLGLVFVIYQIIVQLRKPRWDGRSNFNFTISWQDQFLVVSYKPSAKIASVLYIPADTYISLAKGFGEYPAGSVWPLGELEDFGGGRLAQLSAQHFLGVPIRGWGRVDESNNFFENDEEEIKVGKKELIVLFGKLIISRKTNIGLFDLVRLFYSLNSLPLSNFKYYSLQKTRSGEYVKLPDGSLVFKVKSEFLDSLVKEVFQDPSVIDEGIIWAVINDTDHRGMALETARLINNSGGEVTIVYDTDKPIAGGIYCREENICETYSVRMFAESLGLPIIIEDLNESRAEVVLVVDEKYWEKFYKR